jgi:hypothetical protein
VIGVGHDFLSQIVISIDQGKSHFFRLSKQVLHLCECKQQKQPFYRFAMIRARTRGKLIFDSTLLTVGNETAMADANLLSQLLEARKNGFYRCCGVIVVNSDFKQPTREEMSFDGRSIGFREEAGLRRDAQDSQVRPRSRQGDGHIHCMATSPFNQLLGRVPPTQAVWRVEHCLRTRKCSHQTGENSSPENVVHGRTMGRLMSRRKPRSHHSGMLLAETSLSLGILTVLGLVLLKLSLNILSPRQWTLQQTLSDAYMTYERAYAQRIPFDELVSHHSPFPVYPSNATEVVEIGKLPGGAVVMGTVHRTRLPSATNFPLDGGTGTAADNPAAMKVWKVQSVLSYQVGERQYAKSRTVIRTQ